MSTIGKATILSMFTLWMLLCGTVVWAYVYHVALTVTYIASGQTEVGEAGWLLLGILVPPFGIANSLFVWIG